MATLLSLHVTVYIDPANKTAFFEAFKPVFDLVVAEPELIFFEVYQSPDEPGKLSWVENWNASREWLLETQLSKPYYAPYLAITEPMFIKPREIAIYDTVGSPYLVFKKTPEQSRRRETYLKRGYRKCLDQYALVNPPAP